MADEVQCSGGEGAGGVGSHEGQPTVKVICNGVKALFLLDEANFICQCPSCERKAVKGGPQIYTPTEYERHAGMAASKKWKYSVRIDDLELNPDGGILTIGKWLDDQGLTHRKRPVKGSRGGHHHPRPRPQSAGPQLPRARPRGDSWGGASDGKEVSPDGLHAYRQAPPAWPHFGGRSGIPLNTGYLTPNSKEKRRWLLTQEQVAEQEAMDLDVPTTPVQHKVSRVGNAFQACLPALSKHATKTGVEHARWLGNPGPSEAEALAIASAVEKAYANSMPRDAIADVHEEELDPRQLMVPDAQPGLLDRKQRVRRRPQWLSGNVNLYGIRRRRRSERDSQLRAVGELGAVGEPDMDDESIGGKDGLDGGLADVGSKDALRVPRMKRSRNMLRTSSAANIASGGDLEDAMMAGEPEIVSYQVMGDVGSLFLTVRANGVVYRGELAPETSLALPPIRKAQAVGKRASAPCSEVSMDVLDSRAGSGLHDTMEHDEMGGEEEVKAAVNSKRLRTVASPRSDGFGDTEDVGEGEASGAQPVSRRHAKAEERYRRLAEEGAPPETLCSLCFLEESEVVEYDGMDGIQLMGKLILVRTSTITHAWVHETCAYWSPEVNPPPTVGAPKPDGQLPEFEGLAEAVRRGRRIKCTECGRRGATVGCYAKNCRRCYHVPCACVSGCLLEEDTRASFCPEHAELHLLAREEAARSAEKAPRSGHPLRTYGHNDNDTSIEVVEAAEEDELAASILLGAMQHNSSEARAPSQPHSVPRPFQSRTNASASRPAPSARQPRDKEQLPARPHADASRPSPSAALHQLGTQAIKSAAAAQAAADIKPPKLPGSTGVRTQKRPLVVRPTVGKTEEAAAWFPQSTDGAARIDVASQLVPQKRQATANPAPLTSRVPPAPVRSKRTSQEGAKSKAPRSSTLDHHLPPGVRPSAVKPSSASRQAGEGGQQQRSSAPSHSKGPAVPLAALARHASVLSDGQPQLTAVPRPHPSP